MQIRFVLFCFFPILLQAQTISQPSGGEYVFQHTECISQQQREEIQKAIEINRQRLISEGRLSPVYSTQQVALNWPMQFRAGVTEYDFFSISAGVDHNSAYPNQLLDYNCGTRTYDTQSGYNHAGTDYFLWPFAFNKMDSSDVEIIAAAAGTIIYKSDGNYDRSCSFNSNNWNAVYVQHSDGSVAWYGHMKNGSLTTKAVGQTVAQGEYLGVVGSSGNSTAPHLHLEIYDATNNLIDPYAGPCNNMNASSWWANQRPYIDAAINHIATNDAEPVFNPCPGDDIRNERDYFVATDTIYLMLYYRFLSGGDVANYTIYRPDNSVWGSWSFTHTGPDYNAAWYYYWIVPGVGEQNGQWKYEVTYNNQTYYHYFYLGTTSSGTENEPALPVVLYQPGETYIEATARQAGTFVLYTPEGRQLRQVQVKSGKNQVDCADIATGIYCWHFTGEDGNSASGKIFVH